MAIPTTPAVALTKPNTTTTHPAAMIPVSSKNTDPHIQPEGAAVDGTHIQEEIHGVRHMNPEETPELLKTSLSRLAHLLDDVLPDRDKRAYLQSRRLEASYVRTDDFRLRFLRANLFDVPRAASSLVKFLDLAADVFGEYALERPIRLDDFDGDELKKLRLGLMQFLPFRDRAGRRILITFLTDGFLQIDQRLRIKMILYLHYSAGTNDVDTQRKGIVTLVWAQAGDGFRTNAILRTKPDWIRHKILDARSLRMVAIHFCTPDKPFYRLVRDLTLAALGQTGRIRVHVGESVELQYALQSYGIPTDKIPITLSSTIKLQYFHQWLWIRQYIEEGMSDIVECPGTYDIVVRQGTAASYHPGNVWFLGMIQSRFEDQMRLHHRKSEAAAKSGSGGTAAKSGKSHRLAVDSFKLTPGLLESLVKDLTLRIRETSGRILTWYDNKGYGCVGWWTVLDEPEQVHSKIEYMVAREFKKLLASFSKGLHKSHKQSLKRARAAAAETTTRTTPASATITSSNPPPTDKHSGAAGPPEEATQVLESDTSMFRSQDGTMGKNDDGDSDGCCN